MKKVPKTSESVEKDNQNVDQKVLILNVDQKNKKLLVGRLATFCVSESKFFNVLVIT